MVSAAELFFTLRPSPCVHASGIQVQLFQYRDVACVVREGIPAAMRFYEYAVGFVRVNGPLKILQSEIAFAQTVVDHRVAVEGYEPTLSVFSERLQLVQRLAAFSKLCVGIAELGDRHGTAAREILRFPELSKRLGVFALVGVDPAEQVEGDPVIRLDLERCPKLCERVVGSAAEEEELRIEPVRRERKRVEFDGAMSLGYRFVVAACQGEHMRITSTNIRIAGR